jgi:hypothetical protein
VASWTVLADSRSGGRGGVLPWALLAVYSVASLAANVAVAEPTAMGGGDRRVAVVRAHPGAHELPMRRVRFSAAGRGGPRGDCLNRRMSVPSVP